MEDNFTDEYTLPVMLVIHGVVLSGYVTKSGLKALLSGDPKLYNEGLLEEYKGENISVDMFEEIYISEDDCVNSFSEYVYIKNMKIFSNGAFTEFVNTMPSRIRVHSVDVLMFGGINSGSPQ